MTNDVLEARIETLMQEFESRREHVQKTMGDKHLVLGSINYPIRLGSEPIEEYSPVKVIDGFRFYYEIANENIYIRINGTRIKDVDSRLREFLNDGEIYPVYKETEGYGDLELNIPLSLAQQIGTSDSTIEHNVYTNEALEKQPQEVMEEVYVHFKALQRYLIQSST